MSVKPAYPYWLDAGFRPFFLLGALAMALSVLLWLPIYVGAFSLPTTFTPRDWHVHAMIFGAVPAIVACFALTAVANWTGRPPIAGAALLLLVVLWLAGRVAVSVSLLIGPVAAAICDLAFPAVLAAVFAREVVAASNYRNLRVVGVVALLGVADLSFHVEAARNGFVAFSGRAGSAVVLVLIMLVAGRIVPAFTRNWLRARGVAANPAAFNRFDGAALAVSALALGLWTIRTEGAATAACLVLAGVLNLVRLARWKGHLTVGEPLLFVLHVAYATIPVGFAAVAAAAIAPETIERASSVHVWTAGSVGLMTLAVMTRAGRGHSGRPLVAGRLERAMFVAVLVGAAARVAAPYAAGWVVEVLQFAGLAWALAYVLFVVGYAPMLLGRQARESIPPASVSRRADAGPTSRLR